MNISETQKNQAIKNFYLLCDTFLPSEEIKKSVEIKFQGRDIEGETFYQVRGEEKKFTIFFWDQEYKSFDFLCEVISHEFTHVLFYLVWGQHTHQTPYFKAYAFIFRGWLLKNKIN